MKKSFVTLLLLNIAVSGLYAGGGSSDDEFYEISEEKKEVPTSEQAIVTLHIPQSQQTSSIPGASQIFDPYIPGNSSVPENLAAGTILKSDIKNMVVQTEPSIINEEKKEVPISEQTTSTLDTIIQSQSQQASSTLAVSGLFDSYEPGNSSVSENLTAGTILKSDIKNTVAQPESSIINEGKKAEEPRRKVGRPTFSQAVAAVKNNDSPFFQKNYKLLNSNRNSEWMALLAQMKANIFVREATVTNAIKSITKGQAAVLAAQEELAKAYVIKLYIQTAKDLSTAREIGSRPNLGTIMERSNN